MKTSSMVWTIVIVLIVLGLGWYFWTQSSSATVTQTTPAPATEVAPTGQTQVDNNPTGADYPQNAHATDTQATPPAPGGAPMTASVSYDGNKFSPASVTIAKGGTVTFTDTAGKMWVASDPHPVHTSYDGTTRNEHCAAGATPSFDQCIPGSTYSYTFTKTGSWNYHDHINSVAEAVVIVK